MDSSSIAPRRQRKPAAIPPHLRDRRRLSRRRQAVVSQMAPYGYGTQPNPSPTLFYRRCSCTRQIPRNIPEGNNRRHLKPTPASQGVRGSVGEEQTLDLKGFTHVLSETGFGNLLKPSSGEGAQELVKGLFELFDQKKQGRLDFREFCSGIASLMDGTVVEKLTMGFKAYDRQGRGYLELKEAEGMMKAVAVSMFDEESDDVERVMGIVHRLAPKYVDKDGKLSQDSFAKMAMEDPEIEFMFSLGARDLQLAGPVNDSSPLIRRRALGESPPSPSKKIAEVTKKNEASWWVPTFALSFAILLVIRVVAALTSGIADCDETFNYWEPTHFVLFGSGLQTWEYSPQFALRSYLYVALLAAPGWITQAMGLSKMVAFYAIRFHISFLSSICDAAFITGVGRCYPRSHVALITFIFLCVSAGTFLASPAFLPSQFAASLIGGAHGLWMQSHSKLSVILVAAAGIIGWPFAVLVAMPMAIDLLWNKGFLWFMVTGLQALVLVAGPSIAVDSLAYGKPVLAAWSIVKYNVFGDEAHGSHLYGTEPWWFYAVNLVLNFNIVIGFILFLPLRQVKWKYLIGLPIWFIFMSVQPHKEERFLFPIYSLVCGAAALGCDGFSRFFTRRWQKHFIVFIAALAAVLSTSRIIALNNNYGAPMKAWEYVAHEALGTDVNVCVGKEWYRFPSSFVLPHSAHLRFIKSGFDGQLPQPFKSTQYTNPSFNDLNLAVPQSYVDESECHYLVDLDFPGQSEEHYGKSDRWRIIQSWPFLDPSQPGPGWSRAFWIPKVSNVMNRYVEYQVLIRK